MTAAVAQQIQSLTPQQRAVAEQRADFLVHAFGTLARKPNLTRNDVLDMAGAAIAAGKTTLAEVGPELARLPQEPKQLRGAVQQLFKAQLLTASLLSGSQQSNLPVAAVAPQQQSQMPMGGVS